MPESRSPETGALLRRRGTRVVCLDRVLPCTASSLNRKALAREKPCRHATPHISQIPRYEVGIQIRIGKQNIGIDQSNYFSDFIEIVEDQPLSNCGTDRTKRGKSQVA